MENWDGIDTLSALCGGVVVMMMGLYAIGKIVDKVVAFLMDKRLG